MCTTIYRSAETICKQKLGKLLIICNKDCQKQHWKAHKHTCIILTDELKIESKNGRKSNKKSFAGMHGVYGAIQRCVQQFTEQLRKYAKKISEIAYYLQ